MSELSRLERTYSFILNRMVQTGRAPFYTELAAELGVSMEEGRKALQDLLTVGFAAWVFPKTDFIASFSPFSNLPTQYKITVAGEEKWFGQCGFESLAVSWLFRGKKVTIEAPCLDCGLPMRVDMKDGVIENAEPQGLVGYTSVPVREWATDWPYN